MLAVILSASIILIIDMQFPIGIVFGILYVIPTYISFYSSKMKHVYFAGILSFIFIILGAVISPALEGGDIVKATINRLLSLTSVIALTILGASQKKIKDEVFNTNKELANQTWIKNGQIALQESIKGEKSLIEISEIALYELVKYIAADIGVFYLVDDNNKLTIVAGYAYPPDLKPEFDFNEGLVGRVASEQKIMRMNQDLAERISLQTSLGKVLPKEIIALPLISNSQTVGVLEFAFSNRVDDKIIDLLETIRDSLGISLNSAIVRDKVNQLLEETQRQAEELTAQQEELKSSNEELQQKSVELEYQQRELEATNEELEEQRASLEEQKHQLEDANKDLVVARREIEEKVKDLATSSKYKSDFLANMSHELRTPLNSILILSKLLYENKENSLNTAQIENAKIIYDSGNDLLNLINDILDLSKVEAGKLEIHIEEIAVENLASNLDRAFRTQIESKGIQFTVELAKDCPKTIYSDNLRLEQIIKNFLSNAIKFTQKGEIKICFEKVPNAEQLSIKVQDTGIGIPEDKRKLIFEAFQQVDSSITRRFGGTGLGLSISRSLTSKLDGEIIVESQEGKGSTFTLCIPLELKASPDEKTRDHKETIITSSQNSNSIISIADDRSSLQDGDKVILVFEADKQLATSISDHCHNLGYKCVISTSGENGLNDVIKFNPSSIIVDTDLPDQNGLIVLDRLKNNPKTRHIPTYVVSTEQKRFASLKLGAVGVLDKNKELDNIPEIIKKLERIYQKDSKKVLLIEDNKVESDSIKKLINDRSIEVDAIDTGAKGREMLKEGIYDCVILDLKLPDMTGFEFLDSLSDFDTALPPIIVYTGKDLNQEEQRKLEEKSNSIVIKGVKSPERLLNEVTLFLHKIEADMPEDKQKILKYARHREQVYEGKKVLIVDDDIRNVYSLKQILQDRNMDLYMASTGKEALEKLVENPDIDIVLMDIMMPIMNGYEAMEEIRRTKDRKQLPILALTAKAMPGDRDKCLSSGANDYIPKPIDPDRLLSLLRVWLSQ